MINEAIKEIIFNLEKYDRKQSEDAQASFETQSAPRDHKYPHRRGKDPAANTQLVSPRRGGAQGFPYKSHDPYPAGAKSMLGGTSQSAMQHQDKQSTFLPRLAKQKVLDKFIDLSTADVFHHSGMWPHVGTGMRATSNGAAMMHPGTVAQTLPSAMYGKSRKVMVNSALDTSPTATAAQSFLHGGVNTSQRPSPMPVGQSHLGVTIPTKNPAVAPQESKMFQQTERIVSTNRKDEDQQQKGAENG